MEVHFRRTGDRRYALTIVRKDLPPLQFGGPGYDPIMPHDDRRLGIAALADIR